MVNVFPTKDDEMHGKPATIHDLASGFLPKDRESFPEMYERSLVGPLFLPWAEVLLQRVELAAGNRVLDVACGTGIVARLAKERLGDEGRVVGVDVNPQMLAVACAIAPNIDWREGSADDLPVDGGETFDVLYCQQGLQFFPDKPLAVREMRRVLAPGGRLAVATWCTLDEIPLLRELHRVAERRVGAVVDARYGFGHATPIDKLFVDAGFHDVRVESMSRTIRFADAAEFVWLNAMAIVGMSTASQAMDEAKRAEVVAAIASESSDVLAPYSDEEGVAFEISTKLATAVG